MKKGRNSTKSDKERSKLTKLDFPRVGFRDKVPELVLSIHQRGGEASLEHILKDLKISSGASGAIIAGAKHYGLISSVGKAYNLTELGIEYAIASTPDTKNIALVKAFLNVQKFKLFFQRFNFVGDLPPLGKLKDSVEQVGFPKKYSAATANIIKGNLEYLNLKFQDVKNFRVKIGEKSSESESKNQIDLFAIGFKFSQLISTKQTADKLKKELNSFKETVSGFCALKKEIEKSIVLLDRGVITSDNFIDYAKITFLQAIEQDTGQKMTAPTKDQAEIDDLKK